MDVPHFASTKTQSADRSLVHGRAKFDLVDWPRRTANSRLCTFMSNIRRGPGGFRSFPMVVQSNDQVDRSEFASTCLDFNENQPPIFAHDLGEFQAVAKLTVYGAANMCWG
jgi:hypothetical protein